VKWVGNDFRDPYQPGLNVLDDEELHGSEQQCTETDHQPDHSHVAHEVGPGVVIRENPEQRGIEPQYGGR